MSKIKIGELVMTFDNVLGIVINDYNVDYYQQTHMYVLWADEMITYNHIEDILLFRNHYLEWRQKNNL